MGFQGGHCKKMENFKRVTIDLTGNPGGQLKKILNGGGGYNFFLEKPNNIMVINTLTSYTKAICGNW